MRVGVNYTPSRGWFHSWLDFDADAVARDFDQIASLGLDHVRVFPLWPVLQPNRGLIRPQAIADVVRVADLAARAGLSISVDALNGHLSSFDFLPAWLTSWHAADLFTDPVAVAGERALVCELAEALREHPGITGMTLGNEFAQFAAPTPPHRHPHTSTASWADVDAWFDAILSPLERAWPSGRHHHCFDDDVWFLDEHPFTPRHGVTRGAETTAHAWVFGAVGPRYGPGHPALASFARYLLELARAWSPDAGRGLWLQEFGAPRPHVPEDQAGDHVSAVVDAVIDTPGLSAITWWCSHDVDRSLLDFPELEHSLGLFTSLGRRKPEAHALAERMDELHAALGSAEPESNLEFRADWASGAGRSVCSPTGELFDRWQAEFASGRRMGLVRLDPEG